MSNKSFIRGFVSLFLKLGGSGIPTKTSKWIWKGIHCTLPTSNQKICRIPGIFLFTCLSSFRTRPLLPNGHKNALTKRRSEECSGSKWIRNLSEGVFFISMWGKRSSEGRDCVLCGPRGFLGSKLFSPESHTCYLFPLHCTLPADLFGVIGHFT